MLTKVYEKQETMDKDVEYLKKEVVGVYSSSGFNGGHPERLSKYVWKDSCL